MKKFLASASLVILVLGTACTSDDDDLTQPPAEPLPDIAATVQAGVQATVSALPQATAEPETLSAATILATARENSAISADWDALRADIDRWRSALIVCDASSVRGSLLGFAGTATALANQARDLPGDPLVRELADLVIEAVEGEAAAYRALRDTWTPDDTAPFEVVEDARSIAAELRRRSVNQLADLNRSSSSDGRAEVATFSQAEDALNDNWELFLESYEVFRQLEPDLEPAAIITELGTLVVQSSEILALVRGLPKTEETRPVVQLLAQAAEETDLALRLLRDAVRPDPDGDGSTPITTAFVDFETQLVTGSGLRLEASQLLADVVDKASRDTAASVAGFGAAFEPLAAAWDAFHAEFDAWLLSEGGCDRATAVTQLGEFADSYGELTAQIRALPRALTLRNPSDLLLEAVEREEQAMVELRDDWRPFDASVYVRFDQERTGANTLRRTVQAMLQDLLIESGVSPDEFPG